MSDMDRRKFLTGSAAATGEHVVDTMARIPHGSNSNGVKGNLVFGQSVRFSRKDAVDIQLPYTRLYQANPSDLVAAIVGYLGIIPGLLPPEQSFLAKA